MNEDQLQGRAAAVAGKTKRVLGRLAQDQSLRDKGRVQESAGKARAAYGDAKEERRTGEARDQFND